MSLDSSCIVLQNHVGLSRFCTSQSTESTETQKIAIATSFSSLMFVRCSFPLINTFARMMHPLDKRTLLGDYVRSAAQAVRQKNALLHICSEIWRLHTTLSCTTCPQCTCYPSPCNLKVFLLKYCLSIPLPAVSMAHKVVLRTITVELFKNLYH